MIYTTASSSPSTVTGGSSTIIIYSGIGGLGITNDTNAFSAGVVVFSGSNLTINTSLDAGTQYIQMEAPSLGGIAIGDGASNVTNSTVVFGDLNGISFGLNGSTMTASHNAFSATSQLSATFLTTAMASDAGSLFQYSSNTSVITADAVNTATLANLQYTSATSEITSLAFPSANTTKFAGPGFTTTATAGTEVVGTLNSLGLKIGVPAYLTTAGVGGGAALKGSGTYSQNTGTIEFANSNSITFGLTSNQMTASFSQSTHAHDYVETANSSLFQHTSATSVITANAINTSVSGSFQMTSNTSAITSLAMNTLERAALQYTSATSAITSAAFPAANTTQFAGVGESTGTISGTDLKMTVNTDGVSIDFPKWITTYATGGGEIAISAGASSDDLASIVFSNSYNVSFGLNGSTITASASYSNPGATVFSNSNNVSFGLNGSTVTASATFNQTAEPRVVSINGTSGSITLNAGTFISLSQDGVSFTFNVTDTSAITSAAFPSANTTKFAGVGVSSTTISGIDLKFTHDSLGLSYAQPAYITTYAQSAEPRVVSLNGSSGSMSLNVGSSLSASSNASSITIGLASNITTALQSAGAYLTGYTETQTFVSGVGNANTLYTSGTVIIQGQNNITVNSSVGTGASSNSQYLNISGPNAVIEVQASNGTLFGGTAYLSGYSNLTVSQTNNTFRFSVADAIPLGNSTAYNSSVLSATFQTTGNYLTTAMASQSTSVFQYTSNTSAITSAAFPSADTTKFAGTGTSGNNVTFTLNSLGLNLSVAAPEAAAEANWFNLQGNTASNTTASGSTIMLSAGNNITLAATNGSVIQIVGAAGGAGAALKGSGTYSQNSGTIEFANSNSITFGLTDNQMTASFSQSTHTHDFTQYVGLLSTDITGGSATINSSQLYINIPIGTVNFSDGSGVTWGSATNGVSTTITASVKTDYVQTGSTLTSTSGDNLAVTFNTAGLNIAVPAWITTYTPGAGGGEWTVVTTNAGTDILISTATNTNTLYHPAYLTTYAAGGGSIYSGDYISLSVVGVSTSISVTNLQATSATSAITANAVNTSVLANLQYTSATSDITANAMNTSERVNYFYTSNNTFLTTAALSSQTLAFSIGGNSGSTGSSQILNSGYLLAGGANITINQSNNTISIVGGAGGGGPAVAAAGATITNGTAIFSNSNGVSFGGNGSTITAQISGVGQVNFSDGSGISWGSSVDGVSSTITGSIQQAYYLSGANTAGTTSFSAGSAFTLSGGNNITLSGNSNNQIVISAGAGGAGAAIIASDATYSSGSVSFRGTNITIGTSAGGQYIDLIVGAGGGVGTNTSITGRASITLDTAGMSFNGSGLAGVSTSVTGRASISMNSAGLSFNGTALAGTVTGATNCSVTANSSGVSVNVPEATGSIYFVNSNGHSWSSSTAASITSFFIYT